MIHHFCALTAVIGLAAARLTGAEPVAEYEPVVWKTDVGGPRKSVTAVAQSPDGFLWLLNPETLSRFDGVTFESQPLDDLPAGTAPLSIWSDARGFRVAGADGAVQEWKDGRFLPLLPAGERVALAAGLADGGTLVLTSRGKRWQCRGGETPLALPGTDFPVRGPVCIQADGAVWWVAPGGLLIRGDRSGTEEIPLPLSAGAVRSLTAGPTGPVWIGAGGALLRAADRTPEAVPPPEGQTEWRVQWMRAGPEEMMWMEANEALHVYRKGAWRTVPVSWPPAAELRLTSVDTLGNFWYADEEGGLAAVTPEGRAIRLDGISELKGRGVESLFSDREGNTWAGINRVGLVQLKRRRFRSLTLAEGLPAPMVWTVCEDGDGAIRFSGEASFLGRWENETLSILEPTEGAIPGRAQALWPGRDGRLLAGFSDFGVMREESGRFVMDPPYFRQPHQAQFHFIFDDSRGRRWTGVDYGVAISEGHVTRLYGRKDGLPGTVMRAVAEDSAGRVWVGSADNGAAWFADGVFHPVSLSEGLPHNTVYSLQAGTGGVMWIGTVGGGLVRFRDGKLTVFTTAHGLPDNRIMQIIEDGLGHVWVGTRAGLARVTLASADAVERGETSVLDLVVFDRSDGMPTREMSGGTQPAVWKARDGTLWFASTGGLISCHPESHVMNRVPPVPLLMEVLLDGTALLPPAHPLEIGLRGAAEIPPGPHSLELRWTAPCMISGDRMLFSYRLEGVEEEWSRPAVQTAATYGTLPPGSYRFLLRACNHDGTWSAAPAVLPVTVHPRWWQRTDVRIAGALTGAALLSLGIWGLVRARHRRHLARAELRRVRETERARIARDLHDDLGSSLTEISMLATAVPALRPSEPAALQERLATISGKARSLVEALDEIVWAVNPRHDTAESLATYLTGFMRDYLAASGIECSFDVPWPLPDISIDAEPRHSLFLALKEVLNNIVRHSGATLARLTIRAGGGELLVSVEDNGCGLAEGKGSSGDGLGNIRGRLLSAGGECVIQSAPGAGTCVRLRLPLPASTSRV